MGVFKYKHTAIQNSLNFSNYWANLTTKTDVSEYSCCFSCLFSWECALYDFDSQGNSCVQYYPKPILDTSTLPDTSSYIYTSLNHTTGLYKYHPYFIEISYDD